jgi:hypothetical protein
MTPDTRGGQSSMAAFAEATRMRSVRVSVSAHAKWSTVISGGALSRTGGPVMPMPRLT